MLERGDAVGSGEWGVTANAARDAVTPHPPLPTRLARLAGPGGRRPPRCSSWPPPATSPPSTSRVPCRRPSRTTRRPGPSTGTRAVDIGWRDFFTDPRLDALIAAALEHNRDLAVSVARIEEARGFYRIQGAERYPAPVVAAGASRSHNGRNAAGFPGAEDVTINRASINVAVNQFELDFWGRVRDLTESARADYLATVQAQRAFRLSLIQDVASTYLASIETAEQIRLADTTVRSRREGVRITAGAFSRRDHLGARPESGRVAAGAGGGVVGGTAPDAGAAEQPVAAARRRTGGGPTPSSAPARRSRRPPPPSLRGCPRSCCSRGRTCSRRRNGSAQPRPASARRAPRSFRRSRSPACSGSPRAALNSLFGSDGLTWSYSPQSSHADLQPRPTPRQRDRRARRGGDRGRRLRAYHPGRVPGGLERAGGTAASRRPSGGAGARHGGAASDRRAGAHAVHRGSGEFSRGAGRGAEPVRIRAAAAPSAPRERGESRRAVHRARRRGRRAAVERARPSSMSRPNVRSPRAMRKTLEAATGRSAPNPGSRPRGDVASRAGPRPARARAGSRPPASS